MTNEVTYVLISIGENLDFHSQANFCFLTLKKHTQKGARFVVYTDHPEFYGWISSFVEIRTILDNQIRDWIGPNHFFYRIKLKVLMDASQQNSGHLIYLDSDTVLTGNLTEMIHGLNDDFVFMHLKEKLLSKDQAIDNKEMWEQTKGRQYEGIFIDEKTPMWNSGIIALPQDMRFPLLRKALQVNDLLCQQGIKCRLKEQFAVGLVLDHTGRCLPANQWVVHYWGNKGEWISRINVFFSRLNQCGISALEAADMIKTDDWKKLPIIRSKRNSWLSRRLIKWSEKWFPDQVSFANFE